jgi:ketosteroid isomerase-like protein
VSKSASVGAFKSPGTRTIGGDVAMQELERRIDRLESRDAIRQLVSRYGVLIDARDLDALTALFVDDVRVTRTERGHAPMRVHLEGLVRQFTTSIHFVGNHTIDLVDDDHAEGVVYCRAEHEVGEQWIVMAIQYWDRYERRDRRWLFTGRKVKHWYAVDMLERPTGPDKTRCWMPADSVRIRRRSSVL